MQAFYDLSDIHDFSYQEVMKVTSDEDSTTVWCLKDGLLKANMLWPRCDKAMTLGKASKLWRCRRTSCGDIERSVRVDSFSKSRLPLSKLVRLMFEWASRKAVSTVTQEQEVSPTTTGDWFNFCRDVCSKEMLSCEMKPRHAAPRLLAFGGVDRSTKKWFGLLTYGDRTKPTLSALISKHIKPRTKIMSDKFGSYVSTNERHTLETNPLLRGMNYTHAWVNHSENFVDPISGANTQSIERVWEVRVKQYLKAMRGAHRDHLPGYLDDDQGLNWSIAPVQSASQKILSGAPPSFSGMMSKS
ncbi:hypothetical protein H257_14672 [Aphanomyces astaci]|uniref:ISXO2-like transposase domain-containing protein n=1 Tax=Aphanomyces astaci TaxID=112090 RepID=W4FS55_APHAT|nr:hypothetical protein H257_14672 [Aphanomyces astaci]ETV69649.1 hypothetical protein H257_14672 [Aphanomyces astaci]|eukprot:XP_009840865.1 hypothetical protein H257_14672 [Aphanomyces astaci]